MNILKKSIFNQSLKSELKIVKNTLLRTSTMNPSFSFKNNCNYVMNVSNGFALTSQRTQISKNLFYLKKSSFSSNLPGHIKLTMPSLSPTMSKGNIVRWDKKEGEEVKSGDIVASIETDKAQVDFQVNEEGWLAKIFYPEGSKDVDLGELVAILAEEKKDIEAFKNLTLKDFKEPAAAKVAPEVAQAEIKPQEPEKVKEAAKAEPAEHRIIASPLAKKTAHQNMLDLAGIKGTGPRGRIIQADVLEAQQVTPQVTKPAVSKPPTVPVTPSIPAAEYEDIELTNIRKIIAERLLFSKTNIPHFYVNIECSVDKLMEIRAELNKHSAVKISVNDILIKAVSLACLKVPETNSSWQGNYIRKYKNVDMSVAVSTDSGLITPIITQSNLRGLADISKEMGELREKARTNKLKPHEFQGGTFTISNMGMLGVNNFTAIINPPQACILAVGKSEKRVVYDENAKNKEQPYKVVTMMNATLSCDHRVVDGAIGAKWAQEFKTLIENPQLMLL